jgi:hypothetical protein
MMAIIATVLIAGGLAAIGSEFPQYAAPMLSAGCVCAVLAAAFSRRRARR